MKFSGALNLLLTFESARAFSVLPAPSAATSGKHAFRYPASTVVLSTRLYGLLDEINSDSYNLISTNDDQGDDVNLSDAYEMFLADLVFSTNDPRVDIMNKYDLACDPPFIQWLDQKIEKSRDPEERIGLRDLYDIIIDIQTRVEVSKLAEQRQAAEAATVEQQRIADAEADADAGRSMSNADVLRKARAIETQTTEEEMDRQQVKQSFYETEITPEIRLSYEGLLKKVLPPYRAGDTSRSVVFSYYDQFDAQFVKVLAERVNNGDDDAKDLLEALAVEQQIRIATATETLKSVLTLGDPMKMEGAIVRLAREGKVDEPFLLLLEANETQARDAGATDAANLMKRLKKRATDEKDKQSSSKEIRLIRKLLHEDDPNEREKILEEAFTPKNVLIVPGTAENAQKAVDGEAPDEEQPMPDVPPPDFINACKAVLLNFGNLGYDDDRGDLATRIKKIAGEAEVVATRIYGKGMTLREQQDRMWKDQTTSIFDLERMEIEAERMGDIAPWSNANGDDDMLMPGFDADGRMQIGGS
ncbi:predicted protein [Phaeodactylum tricornutum CCAP 1055/1]|jgi:hypothetical protein|uniref:Uncharacterized protein n=1 Tax=Phaeodactylum tricornutum (strain CCAP 1055/1) TaxID=556484 RepID=B7G2V7_PHATC|nr:predicted protein [Phaeodactylum tricornutum CCAP 1055/1]EEC47374.1 predicted protein [Phaeodactylum tricornutum CCAP 1055/1]|eukprot:XP_002181451.1 predicted protein [Phaeodactylum tricornutum CCAP 1055/1]